MKSKNKRLKAAQRCQESLAFAAEYGSRVRAVRLSFGHDEKIFADMLGVPLATLRRCEAGKLIQTARVLDLTLPLSNLAGVTLDWLICGKGHRGPRRAVKTGKVVFLGAACR